MSTLPPPSEVKITSNYYFWSKITSNYDYTYFFVDLLSNNTNQFFEHIYIYIYIIKG